MQDWIGYGYFVSIIILATDINEGVLTWLDLELLFVKNRLIARQASVMKMSANESLALIIEMDI